MLNPKYNDDEEADYIKEEDLFLNPD